MAVDVSSTIAIDRPRHEVAAFTADADNARLWYSNIRQVTQKSSGPFGVGSEVEFTAEFLGRRLVYTYEVEELVPNERFVMATAEGPFPMRTTYVWSDAPGGGTMMELRNEGHPSGFKSVAAPFLTLAIKRENRKDLRRLKQLLEAR